MTTSGEHVWKFAALHRQCKWKKSLEEQYHQTNEQKQYTCMSYNFWKTNTFSLLYMWGNFLQYVFLVFFCICVLIHAFYYQIQRTYTKYTFFPNSYHGSIPINNLDRKVYLFTSTCMPGPTHCIRCSADMTHPVHIKEDWHLIMKI